MNLIVSVLIVKKVGLTLKGNWNINLHFDHKISLMKNASELSKPNWPISREMASRYSHYFIFAPAAIEQY